MCLNKIHPILLLFIGVILLSKLLSGCASVKNPTGGPRDTIPPKVVEELPKNLTTNFSAKKVIIKFDEFVKLSNEFQEISVSPAIDDLPEYKSKKNILEISLPDSLEKNVTYTINFGKAIVDENESNILKNYSYVFSTGPVIDSLSISGSVINSLTKEKAKDVTVFVLNSSQDSLFGKKKSSIFTTTDSAGNFQLKNLREDSYRIYALSEPGGGDRIFNTPNEEIGFLENSIKLSKDTSGIKLQLFKQVPATFKITDRRLETDGRLTLIFNKSLENPTFKVIYPQELDQQKIVETTDKVDSAFVWFPELTFDSLQLSVADKGKSLDTIVLRRNKRDTYTSVITFADNLATNKVAPATGINLTLSVPIKNWDDKKIQLLEDSIPVKRPFEIKKTGAGNRKFNIKYPWKEKVNYQLKIAEGAFIGVNGYKSGYYLKKFTADSEDNFGTLDMEYTTEDTASKYVVELLNDRKVAIQSNLISKSTLVNYRQIPTGKYTIRVVYDRNNNGKWDSGNVELKVQPEEIYNHDKVIMLRPNWELEEKMTIPKNPPQ